MERVYYGKARERERERQRADSARRSETRRERMKREKGVRGDKVTRKRTVPREERDARRWKRKRTKDEELREATVGWSRLLLTVHRPSSSCVGPGALVGAVRAARRRQ